MWSKKFEVRFRSLRARTRNIQKPTVKLWTKPSIQPAMNPVANPQASPIKAPDQVTR